MMKQSQISFYKYLCLVGLYASLCYVSKGYAQQNDLIIKAKELIFSDPDESIKITEHLLRASKEPKERANLNLLIAKSFLVKGNYAKAISHAFDDSNLSIDVSVRTKIELNILKAKILRKLYLDKQSKDYLTQAKSLIKSVNDSTNNAMQGHVILEQINMHVSRRENQEALKVINDVETKFSTFFNNNINEKINLYLAKVGVYNSISEIDSATVYINKVLVLSNTSTTNNLYQKANIYNEIGRLHLYKKEFKECEESLFIASRFAEIIENASLLMEINKNLAISYLASNEKNQHKVYNDKFLALSNQVDLLEQESLNTLYNLLSEQDDAVLIEEEQRYKNYEYISFGGLFFVCFVGFFVILKSEGRKKRLREIISYIEITKNNYLQTKPSKKVKTKRIEIPEETEQNILTKLKRFENSRKFLNKDMSLAVLAGQFETNTKYLSGVINKHYHDNFNTFINKLRINYIIDKLKNDSNYINYKISFLAEESGYSSHSSFATVFKSVVGMSPVTFIKLIQEERKEQNSKPVVS
ncbi:helix-turn-helix domain-containing protein [Winogradskyella pulchriflava]|uniref:Helix-turn-helix domain-containing protein n=1 Tax=Winogradskyella pulchriflava TaxID=1110688 RepID=A0ABV6QB27_9FLAO